MCLATGEPAAENLYETLHFQHSLVRLLRSVALAIFEVDHQPELGRSWP
jgi:hypothetical protein